MSENPDTVTDDSDCARLARLRWEDVPKANRHHSADGKRMVFGMGAAGTSLYPWTGPEESAAADQACLWDEAELIHTYSRHRDNPRSVLVGRRHRTRMGRGVDGRVRCPPG